MTLLKVQDLSVSFSHKKKKLLAVRSVGFDVREGETLGIVGESGCGKSALAKALCRLHSPHTTQISGSVLYKGEELLSLSEKQMQQKRGRDIGMIFQDPLTSLNPTLTIGDQISEGIRRHNPRLSRKEALDKAIAMLEKVAMPKAALRAEQYPYQLSGGMRQRAMIAAALAMDPALILADEPTTALDVTLQAEILHLLKEIQTQNNMSILLITHDLSVVAGCCDRVLVMYAGKIVESASVFDLFDAPRHPYTEKLLSALPRLDHPKSASLQPILGAPPLLSQLPAGCAFYPRCHKGMARCAEEQPLLEGHTHKAACFMSTT